MENKKQFNLGESTQLLLNSKKWLAVELLAYISFPVTTVSYYSIPSFQEALKIKTPDLSSMLDKYVFVIVLLSMLISYLVGNARNYFDRYYASSNSLSQNGLLKLKEALEMPVQFKADRFNLECKNLSNKKYTASEVFHLITKPDQQIAHLAYVLHGFLQSITYDITFTVRILKVVNGTPTDWYTWAPNNAPPITSVNTLKKPNSSVSICLHNKSMFIVEDKVKAYRKGGTKEYIPGRNDSESEAGSLLCYPVYLKSQNCYPLVVMISTDKPYFVKARSKLYKWILDQFILRIQLEYNLEVLKENCANAK